MVRVLVRGVWRAVVVGAIRTLQVISLLLLLGVELSLVGLKSPKADGRVRVVIDLERGMAWCAARCGHEYQFAYFFRKAEPHAVLMKVRVKNVRLSNILKLTLLVGSRVHRRTTGLEYQEEREAEVKTRRPCPFEAD